MYLETTYKGLLLWEDNIIVLSREYRTHVSWTAITYLHCISIKDFVHAIFRWKYLESRCKIGFYAQEIG